MDREILKKIVLGGRIEWRKHTLERMLSRGIGREEVKEILVGGEVIEEYPDTKPFPSALMFGKAGERILHIVVGFDKEEEGCYIITVYEPDTEHFESDLKTRRKR
jgi:hypothetical protein